MRWVHFRRPGQPWRVVRKFIGWPGCGSVERCCPALGSLGGLRTTGAAGISADQPAAAAKNAAAFKMKPARPSGGRIHHTAQGLPRS